MQIRLEIVTSEGRRVVVSSGAGEAVLSAWEKWMQAERGSGAENCYWRALLSAAAEYLAENGETEIDADDVDVEVS